MPSSTSPSRTHQFLRIGTFALIISVLVWRAWPDGKLHIVFLDTPGDAILIQTPAGGYVLIDGGSDAAALAAALGHHMPFWQHRLDMLILTTSDGHNLPGQIAVLERYDVATVLAVAQPRAGMISDKWQSLLEERRPSVRKARTGQRFNLGGAVVRVLATGEEVNSGLIVRIEYGTTSAVFDHSGTQADEAALAATASQPTNMLAFPWQRDPHVAFVAALRPQTIVLTDGQTVSHPLQQTLAERTIGNERLYHKRLHGTVTWISDGQRAQVVPER